MTATMVAVRNHQKRHRDQRAPRPVKNCDNGVITQCCASVTSSDGQWRLPQDSKTKSAQLTDPQSTGWLSAAHQAREGSGALAEYQASASAGKLTEERLAADQ